MSRFDAIVGMLDALEAGRPADCQDQVYMNIHTGSTGTRDDWYYEDEDGNTVNAVDRGEVVAIPDTDGD